MLLDRGADAPHRAVVCDASSCTEGFTRLLGGARIGIEEAVAFAAREILPRVSIEERVEQVVLHPTCSSRQLELDADLKRISEAVAENVNIPEGWGCCAFAGDRGMLYAELTASATRAEAAEVMMIGASAHVSCNRTCELGMSRATGEEYRHVLELLDSATARR